MELFYAHYPALEHAFLRVVSQRRTQPLAPWLVVCASSLIAKQLSRSLVRTQGAVANIHFSTISAVLAKLDEEAGAGLPIFPQDNLREFLLKDLLVRPDLMRYPFSRGFVRALKSSLRDLSDALVLPEALAEHIRTSDDPQLAQDDARFEWLTRLYSAYCEQERTTPGYRTYQSFFEQALAHLPASAYLKQFEQIIFYGFYDMTGRQLDFFREVCAHYQPWVFAPNLPHHPAYHVAQKFFDSNLLGPATLSHDENTHVYGALGDGGEFVFASEGEAPAQQVEIVPAADPHGEVFFIAKELLRLHEQQGVALSDMAVICRNTASYQDEVRRVFAQNALALNASFSYPLHHFPLGVFCLNLLGLAANGFERETVLAVLSSPYFCATQKQAWRHLAAVSLVSRDLHQWQDLLPAVPHYDPAFLHWLQDCAARLAALDRPRTWSESVALAKQFLAQNIDQHAFQGKDNEIYQTICRQLDSLSAYEVLRATSRPGEFIHELTDALQALSFHEVEDVPGGVVFTDAVRARGLHFKVVFLLGVEEKQFPQLMPEDPILRDRYRYLIRDGLGYWMSLQAERADEEKLLFFSAATAAEEKLYVLYACRGGDGKETVPSVYVAELARALQLPWNVNAPVRISGQFSERLAGVDSSLLTRSEISQALSLLPQPAGYYRQAGLWSQPLQVSLTAAQAIACKGAPGAFDGLVVQGPAIYKQVQAEGFSASSLQELAACPMKYFWHKIVQLEEPDEPCSRQELAPDERGTAYHKVLQEFYTYLSANGLTHDLFAEGIEAYISRTLDTYYPADAYRRYGIYPLVWEMLREEMRVCLVNFAVQDSASLGSYTPTWFERAFAGITAEDVPFTLRGFIDRIDVDKQAQTFQIVDYKSTLKSSKKLDEAFFTKLIFQPFLYALAAEKLPELADFTFAGSCLLGIRKGYQRHDLSPQQFHAMRPQAVAFLKRLARLLEEGTFFIIPGEACAYCPYASLCRRDSYASLVRARACGAYRSLEEARYGEQPGRPS